MNNFAVFFCLEKPVGNDHARLPVIVCEALTKVRPVGHVVVRATGTSFTLRWLAFTVDAGLSLRAWRLRNADTIHTSLGRLAGVRNAGAALFVRAFGAGRQRRACSVEFTKAL